MNVCHEEILIIGMYFIFWVQVDLMVFSNICRMEDFWRGKKCFDVPWRTNWSRNDGTLCVRNVDASSCFLSQSLHWIYAYFSESHCDRYRETRQGRLHYVSFLSQTIWVQNTSNESLYKRIIVWTKFLWRHIQNKSRTYSFGFINFCGRYVYSGLR